MTTYATRYPLQQLMNTHVMGDVRRSTRRSSARLAEQEDALLVDGNNHEADKLRESHANGSRSRKGALEGNGVGQAASSKKGKGKRKLEYDEEEDGFQFTRTRSKRAKAAPIVKVPEPVVEEVEEPTIKPTVAKKARKKSVETNPAPATAKYMEGQTRRRSARNSGDSVTIDPPPLEVKKKRQRVNGAKATSGHGGPEVEETTGRDGHTPHQPQHRSKDVTKIALPFADTPIIRRNKEMRMGSGDSNRRSSLGMRGRRASSLIDSGKSNALPHEEVDSAEFYKHVESGLPEPRRMRQLLTWCGTRALGDKPSFASEDSHARLAAREIQQQLLKDFSTKSDLSDWFNREEIAPPPQLPQPNPKNIANLAKIEELEQQIARLQSERATWDSFLAPRKVPLLPHLSPHTIPDASSISASILDPSNPSPPLTFLASCTPSDGPSLQETTQSRLQSISSALPFAIDTFAENVHVLQQYKGEADRVAEQILGIATKGLEEREKKREDRGGGAVGSREVLRALSRVLER